MLIFVLFSAFQSLEDCSELVFVPLGIFLKQCWGSQLISFYANASLPNYHTWANWVFGNTTDVIDYGTRCSSLSSLSEVNNLKCEFER